MPLRAKILDTAGGRDASTASIVSDGVPLTPQKGDEPDDVLFNSSYGLRTIELNRPKKYNSLNGSMARKIVPRLLVRCKTNSTNSKEYEKSDLANVIMIRGAGDKAFCAGGDVAVLASWNKAGKFEDSVNYFALEYKLDHLIASYSKPYVAVMDGITMGGGVGLSVHAPFRIATERTKLAMPETDIGFFPEVGASFFLPRLDGALGNYLGLTGDMLVGANAFFHGLATHYIDSSALSDLETRLAELVFADYLSYEERLVIVNRTIEEFASPIPSDTQIFLTGEVRRALDNVFSAPTVEQIFQKLSQLDNDKTPTKVRNWAVATLKRLRTRSPTSLKVTLVQLRLGKDWRIDEAFERELNIARVFMGGPGSVANGLRRITDFNIGVTAKLLTKPPQQAAWAPGELEDVNQRVVDAFFGAHGYQKLSLLKSGERTSYRSYPHAWTSLPTEADVRRVMVENVHMDKNQVIEHLLIKWKSKIGVREKVLEILDRKTLARDGGLRWLE